MTSATEKSPMFQLLTEEELKIINTDRYSVRFHEGEVILKQGTQASNMISVVEGFAKVYIEGFNDRNLIIDFVKPWQLVGAPGVLGTGEVFIYGGGKTGDTCLFSEYSKFQKGTGSEQGVFKVLFENLQRELCPGHGPNGEPEPETDAWKDCRCHDLPVRGNL